MVTTNEWGPTYFAAMMQTTKWMAFCETLQFFNEIL